MALQKQPVALNFTQGLDTKTDPYQIPVGKFSDLTNTVFTTTGRLTKRNGFDKITTLPNTDQTTLTTLNDNLIATGSNLYTFSEDTNEWTNQGKIQPVDLTVQSLVRNSTSQSSPDIAVASNGLACIVYNDSNGNSYYHVVDSLNGSQIIPRTQLPATATNPKAFVFGAYFIVTFIATVISTPTLQYIAINIMDPSTVGSATNISANVNSLTAGYDAVVTTNKMYIAWGASASAVGIVSLNKALGLSTAVFLSGVTADIMSVTATATRVFMTYWENASQDGYVAAFDYALNNVMTATQVINNINVREITTIASGLVVTVFYETIATYSYSTASTDYVSTLTVTLPTTVTTGTVSSTTVVLRGVGLSSKCFSDNGVTYMMVAYGDVNQATPSNNSNQPTYFLIDSVGSISMKLAYSNGGGYSRSNVLPNVTAVDGTWYFPYMITDFLTTVNKGTNLATGTPTNAIYTQTGINLAKFTINNSKQYSSEIAGALHLTGGQLWEFDTVKPVEHGFHVWPENIVSSTSVSSGSIAASTYYYVFTYEWTDNAGQLHRSAPSIPVKQVTTGATSTNTLYVPTLRLTAKTSSNPVRIVGYRWSLNQQIYYQFTSITSPTVNSTTTDSVTITDTLADASILGNPILYTTGGVVENIAAPPNIDSTLFDNRLFLIDAEDDNLLWYSKQVIQNVPVEMSDLLTIYVPPTTGAQGSTGGMKAIAPMDDKLIIFKENALYYINGSGPDNTGANSTYSSVVYITEAVGSSNPNSIVLMPFGLMFQSNKGIWLLGRDLSTKYIGSPVEAFNSIEIKSAEVIPNSTQVRFILNDSTTLMYDYFFDQWAVHTNIEATSGTLYQGLHTYLNSNGQIYQETPGSFKDGSEAVLISLTTGWINVAGLQGFERFYFANLLGTYHTPFKLNFKIAYDYNPSAVQSVIVLPEGNPSEDWGGEALWGSGGPWGGSEGNVFSSRIFPQRQKCQSFKVTIEEIYDPSFSQPAGEGLSLSGIALIIGVKRGFRTQRAARSFG